MNVPLVTIAIPTYNRAESYLREAINSALTQTYPNIEVLIGDNCSTDGTVALVHEFNDERLTFYQHATNIGARSNMNFLLAQAKGEFFLLYADDDQIDRDFVEVCMSGLSCRTVGLITTGSRVIGADGSILRQKEMSRDIRSLDDLILHWYRRQIHLFLCSSLFNTRLLRNVGGFEAKYGNFDDVAAEFKCAATGGYVATPGIKAGLRAHGASITRCIGVAAWCDSALALLELAQSLATTKRKEIAAVGHRVSALRNYALADELSSLGSRWRAYWTVLRKFGFRRWPEVEAIKSLSASTLRTVFASPHRTAQ